MTEAPKVEQVDREAAANIWRDYIARTGEVIVERGMRSGGLDDGLPTLLAAHRLTEPERTAKAVAEAVERCAVIAEELGAGMVAKVIRGEDHPDPLAIGYLEPVRCEMGNDWFGDQDRLRAAIRDEGAGG